MISHRSRTSVVMGMVLATFAQFAVAAEETVLVPEVRIYPSGQIVGLGLQRDLGILGQGSLSILYNRAQRGGNGRHADESGSGFGVGGAYEQFLSADRLGWSWQGRTDLFAMRIDYLDATGRGSSDVTVLQPTIGAGYTMPIAGSRWKVRFGLDLGAEINVETRGSPVGEGAILLLGARIYSR